jgi:aspartyl-tRNA(Asn)/glutamyl-tRNA(Gln) amidotransferase subunit C
LGENEYNIPMNKITKEEVEKVAKLARINITDSEKEKYSKELSSILGYVEKLNELDTEKVAETSQVTGLTNVYREDNATDEWKTDKDVMENTEKLLANAPEVKDNYIKVKKILD